MDTVTLTCDQAIFTSIRSRMGEGYRLVAASRGLTPPEKQTITRNSPSHESMCVAEGASQEEVVAASFYPLPSGRLCIAYSFLAGAEHTGRGGSRVYTHCIVLNAEALAEIGFNPFSILRAMKRAGLATPQLKPPDVLPLLELEVPRTRPLLSAATMSSLGCESGARVVTELLDGRSVVIDLGAGWVPCAEALLLGLPGPLRANVSFSAGLKYSTGRRHHLQLLHDEKRALRHRLTGDQVIFVDAQQPGTAKPVESAWLEFVERLWQRGEFGELDRRTSRPFAGSTLPALERIGDLYNRTDDLPAMAPAEIVAAVNESFGDQDERAEPGSVIDAIAWGLGRVWGKPAPKSSDCAPGPKPTGAEQEVQLEWIEAAQRELHQRLSRMLWIQAERMWRPLVECWRQSARAEQFAEPLIERMLQIAVATSPLIAAEAAMQLEVDPPAANYANRLRGAVDDILRRFEKWLPTATGETLDQAERVAGRWRRIRPRCPIVFSFLQPATTS